MFERLVFRDRFRRGGDRDVEIWVKDGKVRFSKRTYPSLIIADDEVSPMSVKELSQKLDDLGILKWRRKYDFDDYFVEDGEFWVVKYKDSSRQRTKVIDGSDAFPDNWEEFLEILSEVAGDISVDC